MCNNLSQHKGAPLNLIKDISVWGEGVVLVDHVCAIEDDYMVSHCAEFQCMSLDAEWVDELWMYDWVWFDNEMPSLCFWETWFSSVWPQFSKTTRCWMLVEAVLKYVNAHAQTWRGYVWHNTWSCICVWVQLWKHHHSSPSDLHFSFLHLHRMTL